MLLPRPKKTGKKLRTPNFIFIGVWQPCLITQYSKHWKHYASFHTCDWGNIRIHCNIRCDTIDTILYFYTDVSTTQTYSVSDLSVICYLPQRSWGKVMFLRMSVILFTGGGCLSACWDTPLGAVYAGRYGQQAGGTHPTGMHSCYVFYRKRRHKSLM